MKLNIKAAFLSALVLPGLGQIVNGKKVKGLILIAIVNIYILVALALVFRGFGNLFLAAGSGAADPFAVLEEVKKNTSGSRLMLASFVGVWLYAVIDALFDHPADDTPL